MAILDGFLGRLRRAARRALRRPRHCTGNALRAHSRALCLALRVGGPQVCLERHATSAAAAREPLVKRMRQVIPPVPSLFTRFRPHLAHFPPAFPRFSPFFARFHRLDGTVPTSRKPEPRAKKQRREGQELRTPPFVRHPRCSGKDQLEEVSQDDKNEKWSGVIGG